MSSTLEKRSFKYRERNKIKACDVCNNLTEELVQTNITIDYIGTFIVDCCPSCKKMGNKHFFEIYSDYLDITDYNKFITKILDDERIDIETAHAMELKWFVDITVLQEMNDYQRSAYLHYLFNYILSKRESGYRFSDIISSVNDAFIDEGNQAQRRLNVYDFSRCFLNKLEKKYDYLFTELLNSVVPNREACEDEVILEQLGKLLYTLNTYFNDID